MSVDCAFDRVLQSIITYHGENWVYPPLQIAFLHLFHERAHLSAATRAKLRMHSIEVWTSSLHDPPELVAGEIGYAIGGVYHSLTGFTGQSSAVSVPLCHI